jgi:multiple sugar transport system permease protein
MAAVGGVQGRRRVRRSAARRREMLEGYLFISPWVVGFVVFTLVPIVFALYISFTSYDIIGKWPPDGVGLDNYAKLFTTDRFFVHSLWNTLYYAVGSTLVGLVVALLLALLLNQGLKGTTLLRTIYYIPGILPAVGTVLMFIFIFDPGFGLINRTLEAIGLVSQSNPPGWLKDDRMAMPTVISWSIWGMGGSMLIFLAGLQGVPQSLYEAARIDGAGKVQEFWKITLPMITPTIFFNLVVGLIGAFQEFTKFWLGAGANGTGPNDSLITTILFIYQQGWSFLHMGYAAAAAWVLFVVILIFTAVQMRGSALWVFYREERR